MSNLGEPKFPAPTPGKEPEDVPDKETQEQPEPPEGAVLDPGELPDDLEERRRSL